MLDRKLLERVFLLNPPIDENLINDVQAKINILLPRNYKDFLLICNGLRASGNLALHELEDMPERNSDYEVFEYLPGYFMIGDDSGGRAILINEKGVIFEVGMGSMALADMEKSADSIEALLTTHAGKTLLER